MAVVGAVAALKPLHQLVSALQTPQPPPPPCPSVNTLPPAPGPCCFLFCRRRADIVEAMRHAWGGYVRHAWGHDELAPVTQKGKDGFGGLGATIIDSLDTLLMMGECGWMCGFIGWWVCTSELAGSGVGLR